MAYLERMISFVFGHAQDNPTATALVIIATALVVYFGGPGWRRRRITRPRGK